MFNAKAHEEMRRQLWSEAIVRKLGNENCTDYNTAILSADKVLHAFDQRFKPNETIDISSGRRIALKDD